MANDSDYYPTTAAQCTRYTTRRAAQTPDERKTEDILRELLNNARDEKVKEEGKE